MLKWWEEEMSNDSLVLEKTLQLLSKTGTAQQHTTPSDWSSITYCAATFTAGVALTYGVMKYQANKLNSDDFHRI